MAFVQAAPTGAEKLKILNHYKLPTRQLSPAIFETWRSSRGQRVEVEEIEASFKTAKLVDGNPHTVLKAKLYVYVVQFL